MSNQVIEQIISQADLVKIIGKHVELKRSGNEFKACCPFHGEKTPSFFINPQKGVYNCFGCGVAGNALTFLKEYEHLTTQEALQELSRQTGIELPKEPIQKQYLYQRNLPSKPKEPTVTSATASMTVHPNPTVSPVPSGLNSDFNPNEFSIQPIPPESTGNLYELLQKVQYFYQQQLIQNPLALQYFQQRGLSQKTLLDFCLGYAPSDWQHLEKAFPYDIEGLKILGLIRTSQKGKTFNLLRHRVIFPIKDGRGRTIAFAGRALSDEDMPKYINSSDSPVFRKQNVLYGLYESRQAKAQSWLVVEGYMDVISLYQAGIYGAIASMGTAIATNQIEKLLQLNPTLTFCFDGDNAGQTAAWRAMESALPVLNDGKELRFLTLPKQHDPDTFIKAHGISAMQQQIHHAIPLSQYLFSTLSRQFDIQIAEGRGKLLNEISKLTKKLPKGSYGWLLREDIRNRLGLGKRQQNRIAQDTLLNFKSELDIYLQLQLCFLYQPELLGNLQQQHINSQMIQQILDKATANQIHLTHIKHTNHAQFHLNLTWQDLADTELLTLIQHIQQHQTHITLLEQADELDEMTHINVKAHFILSGLPHAQQQRLASHWAIFFYELSQRFVVDIADFITEMICQLLIDTLKKHMKITQDMIRLVFLRKQIQCIFEWQQNWLEKNQENHQENQPYHLNHLIF